ncbi:adenosylcobinamide-GDP ribazoletransferase [Thermoactinospora rubra]|uniref:adenosylcobinamide-GDP ribazoletransferase n=1 Tax=Thermoactinospora rubra TaxID=1088767 RepID=UPI000A0F64C9|nr:adenosylcobinamide-GDP ribazoletransferase [Thermoactinospora rubra]
MRFSDGLRLAVGTLTVFPVRVPHVDRRTAGQAMLLAPAVGLALGLVAAVPTLAADGLLGAALALGALALLTRGLHLDGLADLADGLGSGKPAPEALQIMRKSDIGPFGVMTLVITLLTQAAALSSLPGALAPAALVSACMTGRLALTWACRTGVPAARPEGLGAMVAGTVRPGAAAAATAGCLLAATAAGLIAAVVSPAGGSGTGMPPADGTAWIMILPPTDGMAWIVILPFAVLAGLAVALLLLRHSVRRLGGITGDVLGALLETATTAALVASAVLSR